MNLATGLLLLALVNPCVTNGVAACAATQDGQSRMTGSKIPDELSDPLKNSAYHDLVREVERAKNYKEAGARVLVWAAASDALWDFDPAKSRDLLRQAYTHSDRASAVANEGESPAVTAVRTTALQGRLRAEVLGVAQRRDPALVAELLAARGRKEDHKELLSLHQDPLVFGSSSFQKRSLAQLAAKIARTDPARAVEYAADSLGYGVPQEIQEVFRTLISTDLKYARELFERATQVYAADSSPNLYDTLFLLSYLRLLPQPETDTRLARSFLSAAFKRAQQVHEQSLSGANANNAGLRNALFQNLNQLHVFFRIYWPEKAGEVWSLSKQLSSDMRPEEIAAEDLFPTETSRNDPDEIISRAGSQKDEDNRDALYFQAALTLSKQSEHERALSVAGRARDGEKRQTVVNHIRRAMAQHLIKKGELNDALRVIEKIETPEERADATLMLVNAARKKKDIVLATGVLVETQKFLSKQPGSVPNARSYLWLASTYSSIDPQAGFEMMSAAVKLANSARGLNDVRSEPKLMQLGGASRYAIQLGDTKGDFSAGFQTLARADFTRTISIAEGFENELLRGISIITAATSILKEKTQSSLK